MFVTPLTHRPFDRVHVNVRPAKQRALLRRGQLFVRSQLHPQYSASEVVVVGAGAAGLTAAYFAACKGAKVLRLDILAPDRLK